MCTKSIFEVESVETKLIWHNDILIIFYRRTNRQLFSTLIYVTFYAICPQILFWISPLWNVTAKTLIPFVSFFAALFNLIVVFIVCSRSLKEEMERNLNL